MSDSSKTDNPKWLQSLLDDPLNLPDGSDFVSVTLPMTYAQFIEMSERYLPAINSRPDFVEWKISLSFNEPFRLLD